MRNESEPALAFCGFDGGGPRHLLDFVGFKQVIECGLGGRADDFDSMLLHTLPISGSPTDRLWPAAAVEAADPRAERLAAVNPVYQEIGRRLGCGQVHFAGRAVAVAFVGLIAAALVMGEALRMVNGGERFDSIELRLESPSEIRVTRSATRYAGRAMPRLAYQQETARSA